MSSLTLYDLNKQMYSQMSPMTKETMHPLLTNIGDWFSKSRSKWFMLMCYELRYYTIFNFARPYYNKALTELQACAYGMGDVVGIEYNHERDYWEIWIKNREGTDTNMFVLFDCSGLVVDID